MSVFCMMQSKHSKWKTEEYWFFFLMIFWRKYFFTIWLWAIISSCGRVAACLELLHSDNETSFRTSPCSICQKSDLPAPGIDLVLLYTCKMHKKSFQFLIKFFCLKLYTPICSSLLMRVWSLCSVMILFKHLITPNDSHSPKNCS